MKSCPVKSDPIYVEVERELGASRSVLAFQRNNETMPNLLKAYKILNLTVPNETLQRKRNEGYKNVRDMVESGGLGIPTNKVSDYKDVLEQYGYDVGITITEIGNKHYFTDKSGNTISKHMVEKTVAGEKYKQVLEESMDVVIQGINDLWSMLTVKRTWINLKERLKLPDNFFNSLRGIITDLKDGDRSFSDRVDAQMVLITAFSNNQHLRRLINHYQKNPEVVKSFLPKSEYNYLADDAGNSHVGEYAAAVLVSTYLYNGEGLLGNFPLTDSIKDLVVRAGNHIKDKLEATTDEQLDEIFDNYEQATLETDTFFERKTMADTIAKNLNVGTDIGSVQNTINRRKEILKKLLDIESTRAELQRKGAKDKVSTSRHTRRVKVIIDQAIPLWHSAPEKINYLLTIYEFLNKGLVKELAELNTKAQNIKGEYSHQNAGLLLSIKRTLDAYKEAISVINEELKLIEEGYAEAGVVDSQMSDLTKLVGDLESKLNSLETSYKVESNILLRKFFSPFIPAEGIMVGKKKYTVDDFINSAEDDIGMIDRYLQSVKDSNSPFLRILNEPVRVATLKKYNRTRDYAGRIMDLRTALKKDGYSNDKFMYALDEKGVATGNFISKLDQSFYDSRADFIESFTKANPTATYQDAVDAFMLQAGTYDGNTYIPNNRYLSEDYKKLSAPQRKYYDGIIEIKDELNKLLPFKARSGLRAPQVRKSTVERLFSGGNVIENIGKALMEGISVQQHDNVILEKNNIGNKGYKTVPIRNIALMEDMSDLALDAAGGMIAFADMAINYDEMNNIVDAMEIMKDHISNGAVNKVKNGMKVVRELTGGSKAASTIEGAASALVGRMDDFYAMNIYGEKAADEGTIGKTNVSKRKATNQVIKFTVLNTLAFNALAGVANIITGKHNTMLEAVGGEFFKTKDLVAAEAEYWKNFPSMVGDLESAVKKSKVNKIVSLFRVEQGMESDFRNWDLYKTNRLFRMLNPKHAFMLTTGGEHFMASTLSMSVLKGQKVLNSKGETVDLYSQIDTTDTLAKIKEGTKNLDGTDFATEDLERVQGIIRELNERTQGIYNNENMAAFQSKWTGALVFLYRRYFIPTMNRRFQAKNPNLILGQETEGFYRTLGRVMKGMFYDGQQLGLFYNTYKHTMTPADRANVKRALYELGYVIAATIGFSIMGKTGFGDEDDPYWQRMAKYQMRRTVTEVGAFTPVLLPFEMLTLVNSPSASLDYLDKFTGFLKVGKYFHEYQSGPYKGMMGWQKNLVEVAPYYRNFIRNGTPEQTLKYMTNK